MSYEEIGRIMGLSTSRVQQIERQALAKLRRALEKQDITAEDLTSLPSHDQTFELPSIPDRPQ